MDLPTPSVRKGTSHLKSVHEVPGEAAFMISNGHAARRRPVSIAVHFHRTSVPELSVSLMMRRAWPRGHPASQLLR